MKLAVLFSGGKDSTYALFKAKKDHEIVCLISIFSKNKESYMFHTANIELTRLQAESLNLPLICKTTKGEKEVELEDLKQAIKEAKEKYKIQGVVTGAIASKYQKGRIQKICNELNLECINPLWGKDQIELLKEIINENFEFIISAISAEGLNESWLGKKITKEEINNISKMQINAAFEGGEAETLIIDCPIFKSRLIIEKAQKIMENQNTGLYRILKAKLGNKD